MLQEDVSFAHGQQGHYWFIQDLRVVVTGCILFDNKALHTRFKIQLQP